MLKIDLAGKVVVVVGGSRGIGQAIVRCVADAGAKVAWTYRAEPGPSLDLAAELRQRGVEHLHAPVDCTDQPGTVALLARVMQTWGRIDGLVYNAGVTDPLPMLEIPLESWRQLLDVNLTGAFIAVQAALPLMLQGGGGSVVLIGSAAIVAGGGGRADYAAAKAGLEGFSRAVTKDFAARGVRCNLVHPSLIDTDMLRHRHPDAARRAALAASVPAGRLGQPADVAGLTAFLLSDLADYITAQSIYVDGGRTFCR